jgi:hypothetical protein
MLGRVISIASVLAWSAIPLGSLLGGFAISWTQNVALVYAVIGVLTFLYRSPSPLPRLDMPSAIFRRRKLLKRGR